MRTLFVFFVFVSCFSLSAATVNVPADYYTIQEGINAASDGDSVQVADGTYEITSPINFNGKSITLRSESGAEATTIRMAEKTDYPVRASVVIFESGETEAAVLDGFTIAKGSGTRRSGDPAETGGGVLCTNGSSPLIRNCIITGNTARHGGGVCCVDFSSPEIRNSIIAGNSADGHGGGVYCGLDSSPEIIDCTIRGNSGSGIFCSGSSPEVVNCIIRENTNRRGGGVHCEEISSPKIRNCTISGNAADRGGGIFCIDSSSPELTSCIVWSNAGGSMYLYDETSDLTISFSCIESEDVRPGEGNINTDPLFCGWEEKEVMVKNQSELEDALTGFSLSLSAQSPCLGAGRDGVDMGAETGTCSEVGKSDRLISLSPGK
jgi:hypothetical protein